MRIPARKAFLAIIGVLAREVAFSVAETMRCPVLQAYESVSHPTWNRAQRNGLAAGAFCTTSSNGSS
jgi:hypothetical protein